MIIALSGFMGCGKSTVAVLLAQGGFRSFDLDETIESGEGRSIAGIFAEDGETAFRKLEYKYLERIISGSRDSGENLIISLGGGTAISPECRDLIEKNCFCIYLRASVGELVENLKLVGIGKRPLLDGCKTDDASLRERVGALLEKRSPIYEKTADAILDIDGLSPESISERIRDLLSGR